MLQLLTALSTSFGLWTCVQELKTSPPLSSLSEPRGLSFPLPILSTPCKLFAKECWMASFVSVVLLLGSARSANGQLPGTGIPGDTGDSLYRSSSLRRRRDASPGRGTVESVGQEGVGVVPERPSLFSTSGSSSFNPFSAALSSLRPEERAEVNQTGVSDALQRYANQEMRRLFAEHLRSLPQEPISSSFDLFGFCLFLFF